MFKKKDKKDKSAKRSLSLEIATDILNLMSIGLSVMTFIEAYVKTKSILIACACLIASVGIGLIILMNTAIKENILLEEKQKLERHINDLLQRELKAVCLVQLAVLAIVKFVIFV